MLLFLFKQLRKTTEDAALLHELPAMGGNLGLDELYLVAASLTWLMGKLVKLVSMCLVTCLKSP